MTGRIGNEVSNFTRAFQEQKQVEMTAVRVFERFRKLKDKSYWSNVWTDGCCVDTVGLDSEMIRKCVKWRKAQGRRREKQLNLFQIEDKRQLNLAPYGGKANLPPFTR